MTVTKECSDADFTHSCFLACDTEWNNCMAVCDNTDFDCLFKCHLGSRDCTGNCPCMENCLNGCEA